VAASAGDALAILLSRWRREEARLPARNVASTLGVAGSALSQWETGARRPNRKTLQALENLYRADGALVDVAWALTTPDALDPQTRWWHNFTVAGGPVWGWPRPARTADSKSSCSARIRWGPLGITLTVPADRHGAIATLPLSVPTPPVIVELDTPGWVDFGHGQPPDLLEAPILAAGAHLEITSPGDHSLSLLLDAFRRRSDRPLSSLLGHRPLLAASLEQLPHTPSFEPPAPLSGPPDTGPVEPVGPARLRHLRAARRLSQAEAAASARTCSPPRRSATTRSASSKLAAHPEPSCSPPDSTSSTGPTTHQHLATQTSRHGHSLTIPAWWDGPIWLQFTTRSPQTTATVRLQRYPWQRHLTLLSCR